MVGLAGSSSLLLPGRLEGRSPFQDINSGSGNGNGNNWPTFCSKSGFSTLVNNKGQDPCQVAADLWINNTCYGLIDPKNPPGLNQLHNNSCMCNTVYYSLLYVCGLCADISQFQVSWSDYSGPQSLQCSQPVKTTYTQPVPPETVIPPWAHNPLKNDMVDLALALGGTSTQASGSQSSPPQPPQQSPPATATVTPQTSTVDSASVQPTSTEFETNSSHSTTGVASEPTDSNSGGASPSTTETSSSAPTTRATSNATSTIGSATATSTSETAPEADSTNGSMSQQLKGTDTAHGEQTPVSTSTAATAAASAPHRGNHLGAILGGVFGGIAAVILAVYILLCFVRRRRRRREKAAMLASGPLDWWRQTDILPRLMNRELSESSTIKGDDLDYDDDTETLHATSMEKKSVTYGEYPDL